MQQVLCDENTIQFLEDNCVFWAGSVTTNEAYQLSGMLRITNFPAMVMMIPMDAYQMRIVEKLDKMV